MKPTNNLQEILADTDFFKNKTKSETEIVITRFNEDLKWTDTLEHVCTVYNKGEFFEKGQCTIQNIPNFGVGIETLLRHIIERYSTLAEITMFCQATLGDRIDQPMYPLHWYFQMEPNEGIRGILTDSYDPGKSQYRTRISSPDCISIGNRTLEEFRKNIIQIPYKYYRESWVRGDWISIRKGLIRRKPLSYYKAIYDACRFERGILVEECWFLERSFYSIFTR
jgi:hypothetical protein